MKIKTSIRIGADCVQSCKDAGFMNDFCAKVCEQGSCGDALDHFASSEDRGKALYPK